MSKEKEPITELKGKQELFCRHFTNLEADTFDNATKSHIKAGYKSKNPAQAASVLIRKANIKLRIKELHAENFLESGISAESVLANIRYDRTKAREAGSWAAAIACDKLEGQVLAMFSEKHILQADDVPDQPTGIEADVLTGLNTEYKRRIANSNDRDIIDCQALAPSSMPIYQPPAKEAVMVGQGDIV